MTQAGPFFGASAARTLEPRLDILGAACADARLAVGIIHDLGNLIQVASSAVTLISRSPAGSDLAPFVVGARAALDRAGAIVRQSIQSARNGAATLENVDVTACLAEIGGLIQPMLNSNIRLHVCTNSYALAVMANRLDLQNAVLNLVFNARDAMPDGGVVSILARETYDGYAGANIEICVADTGIGMTPDMIGRVFDPFFTTKRDGLGGVGLTMVKRFAEELGGSIGIASTPGAGTTVTLRLPAMTAFAMTLSPVLAPT